jgi:hypothetical protein
MDFVIADSSRNDCASLLDFASLDVDVGARDDFELRISREAAKRYGLAFGMALYSPGTEYGGELDAKETDTAEDEITWRGTTWRGLLSKDVIEPAAGQAYRTVSGECNAAIGQVLALNGGTGTMFAPSQESTGVNIAGYQFDRYTTKLKGLKKMLASVGMRLRIRAVPGAPGQPFSVVVDAAPIKDWSGEVEYSQNSRVGIQLTDSRGGVNHLICLGGGQLAARQRVDLYVQADGSIGSARHYSGAAERKEVYDYGSAESLDDLNRGGAERLKEAMSSKAMSLTVNDAEGYDIADIGDIVGGRDYDEGLYLAKPVEGKILRVQDGKATIEISVEGDAGSEEDSGID